MGPCGLIAPLDDAVRDAGLLAEVKPMGTMKLRRIKKKALKRALEAPKAAKTRLQTTMRIMAKRSTPQRFRATNRKTEPRGNNPAEAPAGTFTCNPLPVLDETGVFVTPEAPEILAIKRAEEAQREAEKRAAEEKKLRQKRPSWRRSPHAATIRPKKIRPSSGRRRGHGRSSRKIDAARVVRAPARRK